MTENMGRARHTRGVVARLDRAIQYAVTVVMNLAVSGILSCPAFAGHDSGGDG
jgi:hypothetical protein